MIFFLMTIAGSIPVLACLILLCFKRDSFSVRFELLLLKGTVFLSRSNTEALAVCT